MIFWNNYGGTREFFPAGGTKQEFQKFMFMINLMRLILVIMANANQMQV